VIIGFSSSRENEKSFSLIICSQNEQTTENTSFPGIFLPPCRQLLQRPAGCDRRRIDTGAQRRDGKKDRKTGESAERMILDILPPQWYNAW